MKILSLNRFHLNFLSKITGRRFFQSDSNHSMVDSQKKIPLDVLFCDNHIIVVNKPHSVLSQGDKSKDRTLIDEIKDYIIKKYQKPGDCYLGLVHRLDRPSSGVMIFARTSKAAARLSENFRERKMSKKYVCVVNGKLENSGTLNNMLLKTTERTKVITSPSLKRSDLVEAILSYQSILTFQSSSATVSNTINTYTLLAINMETGRKHQIRCQLAHLGYPICGDIKYGCKFAFANQTKDISLHSYSLTIPHPITNKIVSLNRRFYVLTLFLIELN